MGFYDIVDIAIGRDTQHVGHVRLRQGLIDEHQSGELSGRTGFGPEVAARERRAAPGTRRRP
jgi:hypothetical protein